jgi:hypothetical protein
MVVTLLGHPGMVNGVFTVYLIGNYCILRAVSR